jgi:hypothetical protein
MDKAYYQALVGSPEHYAAYAKEFRAEAGIGFPVEHDPQASYEIDNSYELALDDYYAWCAAQADAAAGVDLSRDPIPDPEAEPVAEPEPEIEPW